MKQFWLKVKEETEKREVRDGGWVEKVERASDQGTRRAKMG